MNFWIRYFGTCYIFRNKTEICTRSGSIIISEIPLCYLKKICSLMTIYLFYVGFYRFFHPGLNYFVYLSVCLTIWRCVCPNFAASTILAKIDLTRLDSPTAIHLLPNSAPNHNKISCVLFLLVYTFDCFNQKNISTRALPWISYLRLLDGAVIRPPVPVLCSIMQTTANSLNMLYCG